MDKEISAKFYLYSGRPGVASSHSSAVNVILQYRSSITNEIALVILWSPQIPLLAEEQSCKSSPYNFNQSSLSWGEM